MSKLFLCLLAVAALLPAGTARAADTGAAAGKTLVAYFSCTGTTRDIARKVAAALDADVYEIAPATPYTTADLDWRDESSRSSREHANPAVRPALAKSLDLRPYSTIVLGYPIWWGVAPRILNSFLEAHDMSGKTLAAFCTSGGSGLGRSDALLKRTSAASARWLSGTELPAGASSAEVRAWLAKIGLAR